MRNFQVKLLTLFLACCIYQTPPASAQVVPKIDFDTDAPVYAEHLRHFLKLRLAEIETYDQCTDDPEVARSAAKRYLRFAARRKLGFPVHVEGVSTLGFKLSTSLSKEAIGLGSNDPLVKRYMASEEAYTKPGLREEMESIIKQFDSSRYPKHFRLDYMDLQEKIFRNTADYSRSKRFKKKERQEVVEYVNAVAKEFPAYVQWLSKQPNSRREILDITLTLFRVDDTGLRTLHRSMAKKRYQELFDEFVEQYAEADYRDPWVLSMLRNEVSIRLAWKARGTDYASEISKENWKLFKEHLADSVRHCKAAYKLDPSLPEPSVAMVRNTAMGYDDSTSQWEWFERCRKAEQDSPMGFLSTLHYLQPNWSGSEGAQKEFAMQCANSELYGTHIPFVYIDWLFEDGYRKTLEEKLQQDPDLYPTLKKVVRGILDRAAWESHSPTSDAATKTTKDKKSGPSGSLPSRSLNDLEIDLRCRLLICAIRVDEYKDAFQLFEELGDSLDSSKVDYWMDLAHMSTQYEKSRCFAFSEFYDELIAIQPLLPERTAAVEICEEIHQVYSDLAARCRPESRRYLEAWKQILAMEIKYHQGEWIDLRFDRDSDLFQTLGEWKFVDENTLVGDTRQGGTQLQLFSKCAFPEPIEMSMEISTEEPSEMRIGFLQGNHRLGTAKWVYYGASLNRHRAFVGSYNDGFHASIDFIDGQQPAHLSMITWGPKQMIYRINDVAFPSTERFGKIDQANLVGITNELFQAQRGTVTIKNFRVRKPPIGPPPAEEEVDATIAYYTDAIKRNPEPSDYYFFRAFAYTKKKDYAKARSDMDVALSKSLCIPHWVMAKELSGKLYLAAGERERADRDLLDVFKFVKPWGAPPIVAIGRNAIREMIRYRLNSDQPTLRQITRANTLADLYLVHYDDFDPHFLKAAALVVADDLETARVFFAKAKTKATKPEEEKLLAELAKKLDPKQPAAATK